MARLGLLLALLLLPLLIAGSPGAFALNIETTTRSVPGLTRRAAIVVQIIRLTGLVEAGDTAKVRAILTVLKASSPPRPGAPLATAELSSSGGDLLEGFSLGYLFREFDVATLVRAGDSCLSSCALAFLGGTISHRPPVVVPGRSLEVGGTVGFHNFFLNANSPELQASATPQEAMTRGFGLAQSGASQLARYISFMGVDPSFIARSLGRPASVWDYVDTAGAFIDMGVCPIGLAPPPVSPARMAANICTNALGGFSPMRPENSRRLPQFEAKRHLLAHVQKNIESFDVKGPLAVQLAAVLASRDDQLIDSVYNDLRRAGVPLPAVVGGFYEVQGYVAGEFDMECALSFSIDDPDKFDLVILGPGGVGRAPRPPPASCPGLYAYDRDDVINPKR